MTAQTRRVEGRGGGHWYVTIALVAVIVGAAATYRQAQQLAEAGDRAYNRSLRVLREAYDVRRRVAS